MVIVENNISAAWGKAFTEVYDATEISPLIVVVQGLDNADPPEFPLVRSALDTALNEDERKLSCEEVAGTIFPNSLWNASADRDLLYTRYGHIYGRIRKHPANRNGVYFQRLIAFGCDKNMDNGVNQLEHIIATWRRGNHRRSALQAAVFDPNQDHTHQVQRGFPCLQQISFAPIKNGGLSVTGFYPIQYMFKRAYGNYLGLCRLGQFMAQGMGLTLTKVICIATHAVRDGSKKDLQGLASYVKTTLSGS